MDIGIEREWPRRACGVEAKRSWLQDLERRRRRGGEKDEGARGYREQLVDRHRLVHSVDQAAFSQRRIYPVD